MRIRFAEYETIDRISEKISAIEAKDKCDKLAFNADRDWANEPFTKRR